MVGTTSNWEDELRGWLKPFLDRLGHKSRRRMCPLYVAGGQDMTFCTLSQIPMQRRQYSRADLLPEFPPSDS